MASGQSPQGYIGPKARVDQEGLCHAGQRWVKGKVGHGEVRPRLRSGTEAG